MQMMASLTHKSVRIKVENTAGITGGMLVRGEGIKPGTRVQDVDSPKSVVLTNSVFIGDGGIPAHQGAKAVLSFDVEESLTPAPAAAPQAKVKSPKGK